MSPLEPVPNDVRSRGTVERTHRPQSRLQKSAADYAVIAICPALIVVMITALTHFLVLCFY